MKVKFGMTEHNWSSVVIALTSEPNPEDAHGDSAFLRWIDPGWKEIEVEI